MHFASLIGLFKSTDSIVILNIVDDLCFKQFLDLFTGIKSGVIKLSISIPIIPFFFFDESKSRDPEIGIFLRQLSSQKELDPTPEPSGNLALSVIWCSISLFTCLDLLCYLICKLLANYKNSSVVGTCGGVQFIISSIKYTAILLVSIDSAVPFRLFSCLQWVGLLLCDFFKLLLLNFLKLANLTCHVNFFSSFRSICCTSLRFLTV